MWLLFRPRPGAPPEVELDAFVTHGQILGRFPTRPGVTAPAGYSFTGVVSRWPDTGRVRAELWEAKG